MAKIDKVKIFRIFATSISVVGIVLLIRMCYHIPTGDLVKNYNSGWEVNTRNTLLAIALFLPIPLHVISIGMIIQKRWLTLKMKKIAWYSIVSSGMWLGIALAFKLINQIH